MIGSGQFIPGFEEQLVGSSAGDEVKVELDFPEDYPAENLAGQDTAPDVFDLGLAVANSLAASASYWLYSQVDPGEATVTPSGDRKSVV